MEIILANPLQLLSEDHMENLFVLMSYPVMATLLLLEHPHKFMVVSGFLVVCSPEVSTKLCVRSGFYKCLLGKFRYEAIWFVFRSSGSEPPFSGISAFFWYELAKFSLRFPLLTKLVFVWFTGRWQFLSSIRSTPLFVHRLPSGPGLSVLQCCFVRLGVLLRCIPWVAG